MKSGSASSLPEQAGVPWHLLRDAEDANEGGIHDADGKSDESADVVSKVPATSARCRLDGSQGPDTAGRTAPAAGEAGQQAGGSREWRCRVSLPGDRFSSRPRVSTVTRAPRAGVLQPEPVAQGDRRGFQGIQRAGQLADRALAGPPPGLQGLTAARAAQHAAGQGVLAAVVSKTSIIVHPARLRPGRLVREGGSWCCSLAPGGSPRNPDGLITQDTAPSPRRYCHPPIEPQVTAARDGHWHGAAADQAASSPLTIGTISAADGPKPWASSASLNTQRSGW